MGKIAFLNGIFMVILGLLAVSCVRSGVSTKSPTVLPEVHVFASERDDEVKVDAYDANELFSRAAKALREGDCAKAVSFYGRLEAEFPDCDLLEPALYNRGLCLDDLGKFNEAAATYKKLIDSYPDSRDVKDAYFRLAGSYEQLEAWENMIGTLVSLEEKEGDLYALDKVEIFAKKGAAFIETDQPGQARFALESAIRVFTRDESISPTAPDYYYSMAQFKLAELTHSQMRSIALPPDDGQLAAILEKKCQLLLDSQYLYTKVIRIGHPHWSGAAAYRTGALYHHLWEDMLASPAPEGLSDEERGVYTEILRKRIKILLKKAVVRWRRTLKFAVRLHLDNQWILQTKEDLKQIEALLETEELVGQDLAVE